MMNKRLLTVFIAVAAFAGIAATICLVTLASILIRRDSFAPTPTAFLTTTRAPTQAPTQTTIPATATVSSSLPLEIIGAPGIGDAYFPGMGNGGYDVQHYDLKLGVDLDRQTISGDAVITARTTQKLGRFNLDFTGLDIASVKVDGTKAAFTRSPGELVITPAAVLPADADFTVEVVYGGAPVSGGNDNYLDGWSFYPGGVIVAGEPDGADTWFPGNNHPSDKATYTFAVTVADGYQAAANGVLTGTKDNGDGTKTWTWEMDDPMASYLATIDIAKFDVVEETSPAGIPIRSYVAKDLLAGEEEELHRIPLILDYYQSVFGPYPFDAGGVVIHDLSFGFSLESQTLVVASGTFFDEQVLSHELAHMWFGDSVSVADWGDIWLNEGFASYAECLWEEHTGGKAQANADLAHRYKFLALLRSELQHIGDPGSDFDKLFSIQVYDRGALTLHALRLRIGDDAFFRTLRTYVERYGGGNVRTADFIAVAETVSGQDLEEFFQQWLYASALPDIPEMGLSAKDYQ